MNFFGWSQETASPELRKRRDRVADDRIDEVFPRLRDELDVEFTHVGKNYMSSTPGGHRRVTSIGMDRIASLISHHFYFNELDAGSLGWFHGRGMVEVAMESGDEARELYVRAELECFHPREEFRNRPPEESSLHLETYYDRRLQSWLDSDGQLIECSSTIWIDDPQRDDQREFP